MLMLAFLCWPYPRRYPPRLMEYLFEFGYWVAGLWVFRCGMCLAAAMVVERYLNQEFRIELRRWLLPPILVVASLIIASKTLLVPLGFSYAQDDLALLVDDVRKGQSLSLPRSAGVYQIERIRYLEGVGIWFVTHSVEDYANWNEAGFVYWMDGANHPKIYHRLTGKWYYFSD